ncbi:MAG: hypothetical protein ACTH5B_20955, partial [Marinomonas sp.]|uniref:hypothetical protein n=1 Tax=Marinomonas sp. TaxID=1904862 RepID=UPI003F9DFFFB
MYKCYLKKVLEWLLGDKDNPFEYTHHAILLVGTVLYIYAAIANFYLELGNMRISPSHETISFLV